MGFHRLEFTTGRFVLVEAPALARAAHVRAYHLELLNVVQQFEHYHLVEADTVLFGEYPDYYQAIASLLTPIVAVEQLTPASRHQFFIATAPTPDPRDATLLIAGISALEQLMGYRPEPLTAAPPSGGLPPPAPITTGDLALDVLSSLVALRAPCLEWLSEHYSPEQLAQVVNQISQLNRPEGDVSAAQQEQDRAWAAQHQQQIDQAFQQQGVAGATFL